MYCVPPPHRRLLLASCLPLFSWLLCVFFLLVLGSLAHCACPFWSLLSHHFSRAPSHILSCHPAFPLKCVRPGILPVPPATFPPATWEGHLAAVTPSVCPSRPPIPSVPLVNLSWNLTQASIISRQHDSPVAGFPASSLDPLQNILHIAAGVIFKQIQL